MENLAIPAVRIIRPRKHSGARGFFSETCSQRDLSEGGIATAFVRDNHAFSAEKGTIRGLHFQTPPFAQDKLVRVVRAAILDIAVDLRVGSPTYGGHISAVISAEEWNQILVPVGFAHGLVTLERNSEVLYKVSNFYSPDHDMGLLWNDSALGIAWRVDESEALLSEKDRQQPCLTDLPPYFRYETGSI
jgi:dTDP-4-dehydrorhamnose 3,5-epimerase